MGNDTSVMRPMSLWPGQFACRAIFRRCSTGPDAASSTAAVRCSGTTNHTRRHEDNKHSRDERRSNSDGDGMSFCRVLAVCGQPNVARPSTKTGNVLGNLSCRSIVSTLRMCRWWTMNFMQMSVNAPDSATL